MNAKTRQSSARSTNSGCVVGAQEARPAARLSHCATSSARQRRRARRSAGSPRASAGRCGGATRRSRGAPRSRARAPWRARASGWRGWRRRSAARARWRRAAATAASRRSCAARTRRCRAGGADELEGEVVLRVVGGVARRQRRLEDRTGDRAQLRLGPRRASRRLQPAERGEKPDVGLVEAGLRAAGERLGAQRHRDVERRGRLRRRRTTGGVTPTISYGEPSSCSVRPIAAGSPRTRAARTRSSTPPPARHSRGRRRRP